MGFAYFFAPPIYSLHVAPSELPYFIIFASFTSLVTWFATIRRRVDEDLRRTRDKLKVEVEERSSLLDLTYDAIFVRDMNAISIKIMSPPWRRSCGPYFLPWYELVGFSRAHVSNLGSRRLLMCRF